MGRLKDLWFFGLIHLQGTDWFFHRWMGFLKDKGSRFQQDWIWFVFVLINPLISPAIAIKPYTMTRPPKIALLIADDHQILLDLWASLLSRDNRFEVCGKAASATIAVEMAKSKRPDIVLMDINIGPIDGFEATRLIRNFSPLSKVIALSMYAFPAYVRKMRAMGGMGYVTKASSLDEMIQAILQVKEGNFYCCKQIETIMKAEEKLYGNKKNQDSQLTQREVEIIQLIKKGMTSKQIASLLNLSVKTINVHRNNIFRKLHVKNVSSLISTAQLMGFD